MVTAALASRRGSPPAASRTWTWADWMCVVRVAGAQRRVLVLVAGAVLRQQGVALPVTQVNTVRKYRRLFKIGDPQQPGSKEELLPAVVRHFQNLVRLPWLPCDADNSP